MYQIYEQNPHPVLRPVFLIPNRNYNYFCNLDARRIEGAAMQRSNRAADSRRNGRYPTLEKGNG